MLKVTLINPPQFTGYPQSPVGLALIAAVLEREGYQVTILDANALNIPPEGIVPLVTDADVVGLTAMTPTVSVAMSIAHHLKKANPELIAEVNTTKQQNAALVEALEVLQDHHCGGMCGLDNKHSDVMDMVNAALALVEGEGDG